LGLLYFALLPLLQFGLLSFVLLMSPSLLFCFIFFFRARPNILALSIPPNDHRPECFPRAGFDFLKHLM
jgi:hypothetical protein